MIIDAHFHPHLNGFHPPKIIDYINKEKIDQIWLLSWEELNPPIPELYRNISIEDILNVYKGAPDRIIPFYAPDPIHSNIRERLLKFVSKGVKGYGELKVTARWSDPTITNALKCIEEFNFPIVFHSELSRYHYVANSRNFFDRYFGDLMNGAFNGVSRLYIERFLNFTGIFKQLIKKKLKFFPGYMLDMFELEKQLQAFPSLNFIAHGPFFWKAISSEYSSIITFDKGKIQQRGISVDLLEKYDNLYADLSGNSGFHALNRDHEFAKWLLEKFSHKLLYGTDNYFPGLKDLISSFRLSREKRNMIFGGNALKLINS